MATINVGDLVRITDVDHSYTQFSAMFRQMGFRNDAERDNPYSNGDVLQVFSVQDHPTNSNYILCSPRFASTSQNEFYNIDSSTSHKN